MIARALKLIALRRLYRYLLTFVIFAAVVVQLMWSAQPVAAAASLIVTPLTWNVVGLDSNNVAVGPNNFPVGARVCNVGDTTATNVNALFVWDSSDPYIDLRAGSQSSIALAALAGFNTCHDFYFEVSVVRSPSAYDHVRRYHIAVTADGGISTSTPTPREIYVERLISQNRNSTTDIKLNGTVIPAGGSMSLLVGNTYTITLDGSTATQGYEQLEAFINFPNTIFAVNAVTTTYTADAGTDPLAATKLYANGCNWENDPNSPNYRSCWGTGKYGGTIVVTYTVTIIGGAGASQNLSTLIYDFSGSSYHYNSDFSTSARIVNIIGPSSTTIAKRFVPDAITPGGVSQLVFTLRNPTDVTLRGVNFTDTLPSGVVVTSTLSASTTDCGSPTFSPVAGNTSLTFSNGAIAPNGSCIIKVGVTAASAGTYNNTTGHLYIDGATDTGNFASATLVAANATACTPNQTMAIWYVPSTATAPPDSSGAPTVKASNVATATASANLTQAINNSYGVTDTSSWNGYPFQTANATYFQFLVDTRHYSNVSLQFYVRNPGGGNGASSLYVGYWDGMSFTPVLTDTNVRAYSSFTQVTAYFTGTTSLSGATTFRITGSGSAGNQNGNLMIDNIKFSGCTTNQSPPPALGKQFSPTTIPVNATSTLTFTISNTQPGYEVLTNVIFSDTLPAGLRVANPPGAGVAGAGCTGVTFNPAAGATTIYYTATTVTAGAICTAHVNVQADQAGQFDNVSSYISSTESGPNQTATGYGTASLTAVAPPMIAKSFAASPIYVGTTTLLTFTLSNPNPSTTLTGVQFTDVLPAGVTVGTSSSTPCGGSLTTTSPDIIALTGASLAPDSSCTFGVTVTGASAGVITNTTGSVSSANGGTGNTASAVLDVRTQTPRIALLKQVGPALSGPWTTFITVTTVPQNVYFRFTVENTGDTALANVGVTDVTTPALDLSDCVAALSGGLSLYSYTTCVAGPVPVSSTGWFTNTAYATGDTATSPDSSAGYATAELALTKNLSETYFAGAGNVLHYSYAVTNTGAAPLLGPVIIADDRTSDEDCPEVITVGDLDNYLDPGESLTCTATYTVQPGDVSVGSITNLAYATAQGVNSNTDSQTATHAQLDMGDLPSAYADTLWIDNGARHVINGLHLGAGVSSEGDGQQSPTATGDTLDDGVSRVMTNKWIAGSTVHVVVTVTGGAGYLVGWFDWHGLGNFNLATDTVTFGSLTAGTHTLMLTIPADYVTGTTINARFRLYDGLPSQASPLGETVGGEVEDYQWGFNPTVVTFKEAMARSNSPTFPIGMWLLIGAVLIVTVVITRLRAKFASAMAIKQVPSRAKVPKQDG